MTHITIKLNQKETNSLGNALNFFLEAVSSDQEKMKAGNFETTGHVYNQMTESRKLLLGILDKICEECAKACEEEKQGIHRIDEFFEDGAN
jgi:hypothetical protein